MLSLKETYNQKSLNMGSLTRGPGFVHLARMHAFSRFMKANFEFLSGGFIIYCDKIQEHALPICPF